MKLIDADALIKRYDETHEGEPGNARKLIEEAQTVGGWISVKERLPELEIIEEYFDKVDKNTHSYKLSKDVLVFTSSDGIVIDKLENDGDGASWVNDIEVTHWMPLPEPPKDGEAGD